MRSKHGHPETLHLGQSSGTLFRDDKDNPVYLLGGGKFGIKWGGLFAARDSLKAIDKLINKIKAKTKSQKVLTLFQPRELDDDEFQKGFETHEAIEIKDDKLILKNGNAINIRWGSSWYVYDAAVADELAKADLEIQKAEEKLKEMRDKRSDIKDKLTKVDRWNFDKLAEEHGEET